MLRNTRMASYVTLAGYPASLGRKGVRKGGRGRMGGREGGEGGEGERGGREEPEQSRQSDRQHYVISHHRTSSGSF